MTTGGGQIKGQHEIYSLHGILAWCLGPIEKVLSQSYRIGLQEGLSVRTEVIVALICPCVDRGHWIELESQKRG